MDGVTQRGLATPPDHESASAMGTTPPASSDVGGWKTDDVTIKRASNGGFIVRCSKTKEMAPRRGTDVGPSKDYKNDELAFGDLNQVIGYLQQEFGGAAAPEEAEGPADYGEA